MEQVYLTRRNLLTLLEKLNINKTYLAAGKEPPSKCTLIKCDVAHKVYPASAIIQVTAVEDSDYYTDRIAGGVVSFPKPEGA